MGSSQQELRLKPPAKSETGEAENQGITRKNSRTRGINFKTVSPILGSHTTRASVDNIKHNKKPAKKVISDKLDTANAGESQEEYPDPKKLHSGLKSASYEAKTDISAPTSADLEKLDINDKLRLLALKEMAVVELKDSMAELQAKLYTSERDLHSLRTAIQRSLYRQLNNEAQSNKGPISASVPSTHKHTSTSALASAHDPQSKLWSNLSKPITFIQGLDHMLLQELERSLLGEVECPGKSIQKAQSTGNDENQFRQLMDTRKENADDMFQAVSSSLWGFVNDMKANMVSSFVSEPLSTHAIGNNEPETKTKALKHTTVKLKDTAFSNRDSSADLLELSEDEDEAVDLSMYSAMRRKHKHKHTQ